jgi:pimeloyl-ACP methyl ester carboxylesterase
MPYVTVGKENSGNIEIHYEDHGSGKPVVLIHGYPLNVQAWEKQEAALLGAGYRVITYDRRGFGKSSQPSTGYDYDTFAEDLQKLVTKLELQNFALAGHSMGGGEVARYLGKYGTKNVSRAAIISGVPPYLLKTSENPEGVDGSVFAGIKKAVAADRPAFFTDFLARFYNVDVLGGKLVSDKAVQASWNISVTASPKAAFDCVDTWGTDFRNDVKRIDIPTLILHGDADRIVPFPNSGKRTHEMIKGSKLVLIEGGPHGIAWTHADIVSRELLAFFGHGETGQRSASAR